MNTTGTYRRRPVEVTIDRWWRHDDHPAVQPFHGRAFPPEDKHTACGYVWAAHGWLERADGGDRVCPGDLIVRDRPDRWTVVHPADFATDFEPVTPGVER